MFESRTGRTQKRSLKLFYKRLLLFLLVVILVVVLPGVWSVYHKERETRANRKEAEMRLEELTGREKVLRSEVAELRGDRGVEAELRQQYEVGREGEQVIYIIEREPPVAEVIPEPTLWERFLSWF